MHTKVWNTILDHSTNNCLFHQQIQKCPLNLLKNWLSFPSIIYKFHSEVSYNPLDEHYTGLFSTPILPNLSLQHNRIVTIKRINLWNLRLWTLNQREMKENDNISKWYMCCSSQWTSGPKQALNGILEPTIISLSLHSIDYLPTEYESSIENSVFYIQRGFYMKLNCLIVLEKEEGRGRER